MWFSWPYKILCKPIGCEAQEVVEYAIKVKTSRFDIYSIFIHKHVVGIIWLFGYCKGGTSWLRN